MSVYHFSGQTRTLVIRQELTHYLRSQQVLEKDHSVPRKDKDSYGFDTGQCCWMLFDIFSALRCLLTLIELYRTGDQIISKIVEKLILKFGLT